MNYKCCAVALCTNTTIKTPKKLFITVPKNVIVRKKWLQLAGRDPREINDKSVIFFCEDHFNLETDMANYYQYGMGLSQKKLLNKGAVPSKFHCQEGFRRSHLFKIEPQEKQDKSTLTAPILTRDISTQYTFKEKVHFRSKATQTRVAVTRDRAVSPFKPYDKSSHTSRFKIVSSRNENPSKFGKTKMKKMAALTTQVLGAIHNSEIYCVGMSEWKYHLGHKRLIGEEKSDSDTDSESTN